MALHRLPAKTEGDEIELILFKKKEIVMAGPASFRKHPIHPMLIPFPIALWIFSLVCDVMYAMGWGGTVWN